jgi:flagellar motility protein MotE (MotC chaperone)
MHISEAYAQAARTAFQVRWSKRRQLRYLPVLLSVPLILGLVFVLGAVSPAKATRTPPAEAKTPVKEIATTSPEPLLTLKAGDIPVLKSLQERQALVEEREKQLATRETELRLLQQQQQLEEKLATLSLLRKEVGELIQEKAAFDEKRFEHLVKVYEGMKAEEAASLIERLHEDTAVKLLYQMKEKKVGQILGSINPEVAAKLSERLAAQRQQEAQATTPKEKR